MCRSEVCELVGAGLVDELSQVSEARSGAPIRLVEVGCGLPATPFFCER